MLRPHPWLPLLLLAGAVPAQPHTDPSRWREPRIYHTREESQLHERMRIEKGEGPAALLQPIHSPNKGYYFMVLRPSTTEPGPRITQVFVYNEKDHMTKISLVDHYPNFLPSITWISEKLLFLRVWWGRIVGTDLVYDVEQERIIYEENFRDGRILFEQHRECTKAEPGRSDTTETTGMTEQRGLRTGFAEVNGARLYYEVRGEGHPLLLLHAGVADSRTWDHQFAVFARHYRVIRFDLRGFGQSNLAPGSFSYHEDVASLLDFFGIERAYVVGQSFGGSVAIDFALACPQRVDALVLGAPNVGGHEFSNEVLCFEAEEGDALERGDLEAATELNLRMWVDGPHRKPEDVDPAIRELVRAMQLQAFSVPVPEDVELRPLVPEAITRLGEIQVPTLVIVGDQDVPEFRELSDVVTAAIKGASKVVIPGVAHLPNMEKPEEFNRIVLGFLSEVQ
jgi:3-oxoadipate enol-lactonase